MGVQRGLQRLLQVSCTAMASWTRQAGCLVPWLGRPHQPSQLAWASAAMSALSLAACPPRLSTQQLMHCQGLSLQTISGCVNRLPSSCISDKDTACSEKGSSFIDVPVHHVARMIGTISAGVLSHVCCS